MQFVSLTFLVALQMSKLTSAEVTYLQFENIHADDVVFTSNIAFEFPTRSKLQCFAVCAQFPGCVTFTFVKRSPLGSCQGHNKVMTLDDPKTNMPMSQTYKLDGAGIFFFL
jgi:hypothetical protein